MATSPRVAAAFAALLVAALALLAQRCSSPEVAFLWPAAAAPWWAAPLPVAAELQQWGRLDLPVTRFRARIGAEGETASAGATPVLELRALRSLRVQWNGRWLRDEWSDASRWREWQRVEFAEPLREAGGELAIEVRNAQGPALLQARFRRRAGAEAEALRFEVEHEGRALGFAIHADDTRRHPLSFATETPSQALRERLDAIAGLFALGVAGTALWRRWPALRAALAGPGWPTLLACALWIGVFLPRFLAIPLDVGFDARHHAAYVEFLLAQRELPLATDGWSTFHPPLFHAATALCVAFGRALAGEAPALCWRLLPFLSGLAAALVAFAVARALAREGHSKAAAPAVALLFAALLPVQVYSAAYLSNEPLHACLAGLGLWLGVRELLCERASARAVAAAGAVLGLAALAKFSALALIPLVGAALAAKLAWIEQRTPREQLRCACAFAAAACGIGAWFYIRNWILLGQPVVANWAFREPGLVWWQQPGFHTPAWYLSFGEALRHPYFSAFVSFWDGLYSSTFGDAFVAGRADPSARHPFFRYDYMSAGYWLALPVLPLLALGAAGAAREVLRRGGAARRRAALALLLAVTGSVALGFATLSLEAPFYSQVKASYGLLALSPLAYFFARGHSAVAEWLRPHIGAAADALLAGWLAAFAGVSVLAIGGPL